MTVSDTDTVCDTEQTDDSVIQNILTTVSDTEQTEDCE